jgi:exopolysaccharide biosynthesis WecB/TagA/CpsF family protein
MTQDVRQGDIFGVTVTVGDYDSVLGAILSLPVPACISYAHFDVLLRARKDSALRSLLNRCSITYIDGTGAHLAFRLLHGTPVARINATDMNYRLLSALAATEKRIALIGGRPETQEGLRRAVRDAGIADNRFFLAHGYHGNEDEHIIQAIEEFRPDVLFLGLGIPGQFDWLLRHASRALVPLTIMTGGFFEFLGGGRPRAPRWMRATGLEWMHRLRIEPARLWRRYIAGIPRFLMLLVVDRLRRK